MLDEDFSTATWRKSTRSGNATAECVEVASIAANVAVRDSKDPHGAMLIFTRTQWRSFITDVTQPPRRER